MQIIKRFVLLLSSFFTLLCQGADDYTAEQEAALTWLKNDAAEVGILPDVGGRIVVYRRTGGNNVLYAKPELWNETDEKRPDPMDDPQSKLYQGHIVWVAPQDEWWRHQNFSPKYENIWPPDPFHIYGNFNILEQSATGITLRGPASPVWGVQMTKRYTLAEDGALRLETTAVNSRDEAVSWNLWTVTRVPEDVRAYASVNMLSDEPLRFDLPRLGRQGFPYWGVRDGWFYLEPRLPLPPGSEGTNCKAYIYPDKMVLAAFIGGDLFLKLGDPVHPRAIHPAHRPLEIWRTYSPNHDGFMELEMHGDFTRMEPGESISYGETWRLVPQAVANDVESQLKFLQQALSQRKEVTHH